MKNIKWIIGMLLYCVVGSTQSSLLSIGYSDFKDSVYTTTQYWANNIIEESGGKQVYDLSTVTSACYQTHAIERIGERMFRVEEGNDQISKYVVNDSELVLMEHQGIDPFFNQKDKKFNYIGGLTLISLPTKGGEDQSFSSSISIQYNTAALTDILRQKLEKENIQKITLNIRSTLYTHIEERQKIFFPFGERLVFICSFAETFKLNELKYHRSKKQTPGSDEMFQLISTFINTQHRSYVKMFNSFKGLPLAHLEIVNSKVKWVDIYEVNPFDKPIPHCGSKEERCQLYPNPSFGEINILLKEYEFGNYQFELFNIVGRRIWDQTLELNQDIHTSNFQIPSPKKGSYLYSIKSPKGHRIKSGRIIIVEL